MAKRFFIGASSFLLILIVLWGIYALFFAPKKTTPSNEKVPASENPTTSNQTPRKLEVLIDAPVISPFASEKDGSIFYIDKNTGSLQKFNLAEEKKSILTDIELISPTSAVWKKDGSSVFVKENKANDPSFRLIPLDSQKPTVSLGWGTQYVLWDELDNNILYTYREDNGKMTLNRALPNGSDWKKLTDLPQMPIFISIIPKSPLVAYWGAPANTRLSELKTVNITSGETKTIFSGKYGANYLWSPNGERILLSWAPEKDGSKLSLAVINKNGGEYADLNLPTMVDKCVWSRDNITIYCALPGSLPAGSAMPDTFYAHPLSGSDTFWKVDTKKGTSERLIDLKDIPSSFDTENLLLSPDESMLLFVNRKDLKLYSIEL